MQVATAIGAAELPLKRSNQLLNQLWVTMKNTMRWRLTTGALNSFIGGLQQAFGYSKSLNASLNDIRIVTGKSADEMSRFAKEANQAAKELSTTTTTYTDASLIYYQQGLDSEAVKERTDATIKMANVTGQSAETISSQMTAVWNNFREGSRTLESYADTMVALGATTASSSKEIAEGLEKFAPIANSVGLSFDYASAALATLVATTRESASVAGNALKTLFSRLEGLKLGETLEDGTDLNKYSQALYTVGINIKDANGELKDMDLILSELGNRWKDLARDEQMALAQTVGGVRQYAQLVALMDNWQTFQQNLVTARTAEGSLEKQAQIYAESWEASRDRVKAAAEDVYDSLINPKVFIDLDKMSQAVLKPLASILDGVGGLTGLLPIVAALMTKVYSAQIANVMRDMAVNIGLMTGKEQERARAIQAEFVAETERLNLDYRDDQLMSARVAILREQIGLQGDINSRADQYSEYQMEQIKNATYMSELLRQQALAQTDIAERAQTALDEQQTNVRYSISIPRFNTQEAEESFIQLFTNLSQRTQNIVNETIGEVVVDGGNLTRIFSLIDQGFESIMQRSAQIETLRQALGDVNNQSQDWSAHIKELATNLGMVQQEGESDIAFFNRLREVVSQTGEATTEVDNDIRNLQAILRQLGADQSTIISYTARMRDLQRQLELQKITQEEYRKEVERIHETLKNGVADVQDWANAIVLAGQAMSQAAMAMRSIDNLGRIFSDKDLANSEKLVQLLTTVGMLMPFLTSSIKAIGGAIAGTVTGAAAFMPILAAVGVAIYAIVKAVDAIVISQEEAQAAIQKASAAYKEASDSLDDLNQKLATASDRLKELQDLAESGSITLVEQEELNKLQLETAELDRQVKLQEKLTKTRRAEAASKIIQQGTIAYQFTPKSNQGQGASFRSDEEIAARVSNLNFTYLTGWSADFTDTVNYVRDLLGNPENWSSAPAEEAMLSWVETLDESTEEAKALKETLVEYVNGIYNWMPEGMDSSSIEDWISENIETYEQLEDAYKILAEQVVLGEREADDAYFLEFQAFLRKQRKEIYRSGEEYASAFLDPVINALSNIDLNALFSGNFNGVSDNGKNLLALYGVSPDELVEQLSNIQTKAREQLSKFGLGYLSDSLSYTELKLLATVNNGEGYETFTELWNYLQKNGNIIPISLQVEAIEDARTGALAALASGDLLDEETIQKLQEVYQGIADLSNINEWSVKEQIDFLTGEGKVVESKIDQLTNRIKDLKQQKQDVEKELAEDQSERFKGLPAIYDNQIKQLIASENKQLNAMKLGIEAAIEDAEKELNSLKENFEKEPWEIDIEMGDAVAAELNNAKRALALINEDLTVSAENLVELGKRYPEALVEATYEADQNVLKIKEDTYNQIKNYIDNTLDHELQRNRDIAAQRLTNEASVASGILNIVQAEQGEEREQYKQTLISALTNDEDKLKSAKETALASMVAVVKGEIDKRKASLETMVNDQAASKAATDVMGRNAEITVENYSSAATAIQLAFDTAFKAIAEGTRQILSGTGEYTSIMRYGAAQHINATTGESGVGYSTQAVEEIKNSSEYKQREEEIKKLNSLEIALERYLSGEVENWDTIQFFFNRLPEEVQGAFSEGFASLINSDFEGIDVESLVGSFESLYSNEDAQAKIQEILNASLGTLQHLLESPEEDKTKGSGKSDYAKLDNADLEKHEDLLEEIEDRYHEITREIERQNRILDQLETQAERTYGLDRLKLYEKELEELNGLYERQRAKQGRAERYLADVDKPRLQTAFQAIGTKEGAADVLSRYGFSGFSNIAVDLNKPGQEIKDFEALEDNIRQDTENFLTSYHAFMVEYDNFLQEYNALTDEDKANQQERALQLQQEYELVTAQFETVKAQQEERLAAIKQYEETLDTINTLAHEMEETLRREEDTRLKEVTHRMDVILDVRDARKQIRDFTKEIAESFGDALTHGVRTAELGWDQAKDEMAMYKEYVQEYNDLKSLLDNATEYTDTEAIVAELRELEGNIIESGQRLLEWSEQVENMFVEALSAAADRFSYFTNQLEHNDAILSTMKELYALQGQTYKTQQGFNRLQRVAQERLETQVGQARLQRKWFEEADSRLQEAQAQLDALIAEKGAEAEQDFRYDTFKKNRDALLKEQQEAQKAMLSAAQQAMETAQQMYLDQIEKAVYEFGQALSGGIGLDLLQDKYDHYIEEEERYLDKVNEAYQVAAWYDKLQKDIDNTTNKLTKDRLKALQQEIDIRREGNTLSQYDLDILEAKYKVLQAQADLEDAQNAKSQLRLVRDSQGNWNYQFTTNPDDIAAKEQELLQAENEWYNIAKEQTKEVTGEIIATWQECQEAINEIYSDTSNFVMNEETGRLELTKEAQERETEIRRFYADKVKFLEEEKQIAIGDMTEAGNQAMIHMAIAAGETVEDITGITGREVESLVETTGMNSQQLLQLSLSQIEDILENRLAQLAEDIGISADDLKDMLQRKENGIESDADSTFKAILESADPATVDLYNLFAENWELIGSLVGETSSGIKGNIADTYTKIQSGLNDTGTAMNLFDNIFAKDLTSMTKNTAIFEVEFDRAVENMQNSFDNYGETIADVADDCGVSLEALDDSVNMVSDSTDRMIWEGLDAAQAIWDQVDATWDAQQGYLDLASAVWEYIYALQALAAEQVVPTIEEASGVNTFDRGNRLDYNGDLSQKMAAAWYNYRVVGDESAEEDYLSFEKQRREVEEEMGADMVGATNDVEQTIKTASDESLKAMAEGFAVINDTLKKENAEAVYERTGSPTYYGEGASFATGGYTGNFDNGRLAILHEKELVLNEEDTRNILGAVSLVRSMDSIFNDIASQLDNDGLAAMALLGSRIGGIGAPTPASTDFEQHVTIESVSFPGVTSSREIEEAFESLVNDAAQWARRRKS